MKRIVRYKDLLLWLPVGFGTALLAIYVLTSGVSALTVLSAGLADWRDVLNADGVDRYGLLQQLAAAMVAVFPACVWTVRLNARARERFLAAAPDGLIPPRAGFRAHFNRAGLQEAAVLLALPLPFALLGRFVPYVAYLAPLHTTASQLLGVLPGLLLATVWTAVALAVGVFRAQAAWRVALLTRE
jgi:hypothetical protein